MKCFLRLNDLFSQGSRQGTLMPGLLKLLYEQLSYHKILPLVCNLSTRISLRRAILVKYVLGLFGRPHPNFAITAEPSRQKPVKAPCLCDNFRGNLCQNTKSSAQNGDRNCLGSPSLRSTATWGKRSTSRSRNRRG